MIKLETEITPDIIPIQYIEGQCPSCYNPIKILMPQNNLDWENAYEELRRFTDNLQGLLTEAHRELWKLKGAIKPLGGSTATAIRIENCSSCFYHGACGLEKSMLKTGAKTLYCQWKPKDAVKKCPKCQGAEVLCIHPELPFLHDECPIGGDCENCRLCVVCAECQTPDIEDTDVTLEGEEKCQKSR